MPAVMGYFVCFLFLCVLHALLHVRIVLIKVAAFVADGGLA